MKMLNLIPVKWSINSKSLNLVPVYNSNLKVLERDTNHAFHYNYTAGVGGTLQESSS